MIQLGLHNSLSVNKWLVYLSHLFHTFLFDTSYNLCDGQLWQCVLFACCFFSCFCAASVDIFKTFNFFKKIRNTIRVSDGLHPGQE